MQETIRYFQTHLQEDHIMQQVLEKMTVQHHPDVTQLLLDLMQDPQQLENLPDRVQHHLTNTAHRYFLQADDPRCHEFMYQHIKTKIDNKETLYGHFSKFEDPRIIPVLEEFLTHRTPDNYNDHHAAFISYLDLLLLNAGENALPTYKTLITRFATAFPANNAHKGAHPLFIMWYDLDKYGSDAASDLAAIAYDHFATIAHQKIETDIQRLLTQDPTHIDAYQPLYLTLQQGYAVGTRYALTLIDHPHDLVRFAALHALTSNYTVSLYWANPSERQQALEQVLMRYHQEQNAPFRARLFESLRFTRQEQVLPLAVPYWQAHFNDQPTDVTLRTLFQLHIETVSAYLQTEICTFFLTGHNLKSQLGSIFANYLYTLGNADAVQTLITLVATKKPDASVTLYAINYLALLGDAHPQATEAIIRYLQSPHLDIRLQSLYALGTTKKRSMLPFIVDFPAQHPREIEQKRDAIAALSVPESLAYLLPELAEITSTDHHRYSTVTAAIRSIGTEDAFAALNTWDNTQRG